ncbi:uncharacterized protein CANTADRAFT_101620 [Suhomyces tanzawaensis NRRL Y-17324]|uniref:Uncharacterized protein n=1 Tax=Suhomyces tanzawaensis NRRL Y-17324 TaxID=984487 RepID=A0A1E4SE31_9ASCO|nr:uncharacterized protein CANTADRAFT_101620 [Suhomyces tanzawaensis NRRL Y-17324]ODV77730.1 hypothetical protein CANTADRAFT_101620 [Suhomyces tanzawaensis NRRL Y-17324]
MSCAYLSGDAGEHISFVSVASSKFVHLSPYFESLNQTWASIMKQKILPSMDSWHGWEQLKPPGVLPISSQLSNHELETRSNEAVSEGLEPKKARTSVRCNKPIVRSALSKLFRYSKTKVDPAAVIKEDSVLWHSKPSYIEPSIYSSQILLEPFLDKFQDGDLENSVFSPDCHRPQLQDVPSIQIVEEGTIETQGNVTSSLRKFFSMPTPSIGHSQSSFFHDVRKIDTTQVKSILSSENIEQGAINCNFSKITAPDLQHFDSNGKGKSVSCFSAESGLSE